jgi:hypothetical protein
MLTPAMIDDFNKEASLGYLVRLTMARNLTEM